MVFAAGPFQQLRYLIIGFSSKFKSERARTTFVIDKAKQVIKELAQNDPVYYEKLRERLKKFFQ
jgi:hypothetical protein